jgi:hypothetical protein
LIWQEGMKLDRENYNEGTLAQAENTAAALRREHPDVTYDVIPFDPERQPIHTRGRITKAQFDVLIAIRDNLGQARKWGWGSSKATYRSLIRRGLIMSPTTRSGGLMLSTAGKAALGVVPRCNASDLQTPSSPCR